MDEQLIQECTEQIELYNALKRLYSNRDFVDIIQNRYINDGIQVHSRELLSRKKEPIFEIKARANLEDFFNRITMYAESAALALEQERNK